MAVTIDDDLKTKIEALLAQVQTDIAVQEQLLTGPGDVTIVLPSGHSYTGPSWPKIADIAANTDYDQVLGPLGVEIKANADRSEVARDAAEQHEQAAQAALTAVTALQTDYVTGRDDAVASAATATTAATNAAASNAGAAAAAKTATDAATNTNAALTKTNTALASAQTAATDAEKYRDEAEGFRDEAEGFRDEAEQFALDAGNSASAAAKSNTSAQTAASTAQTLVVNANQASDNALQYSNDAKVALTAAQQQAQRAKNEADRIGTVSSVDDYLLYDQAAGTVDFKIVPTFNQQTISQIVSASGAAQINTAEICLSSPPAGADMDSAAWAGKTFMVEKPTVSGGVSSNGAPVGMEYDAAICSDVFSSWTPSGGAKGNQRLQTLFDKNYLWMRGYHVELGSWTPWKRIVSQFDTEITGKDLDQQLVTGSYTYTNAINAPVIDASEASTIYFLDVLSTDEGLDVTQTMRSPQTNSRFDRYRIAGVWSKWYNTTATMDVDTAPDGVDLNTLTNPGWFGVKLPSAVNLPTRGSGNPKVGQAILQVIGISDGGNFQHLSYVDTGEVWMRYKPADVSGAAQPWKPWQAQFQVGSTAGAIPITQGGTGAVTLADAKKTLGVERFIQDASGTEITTPDKKFNFAMKTSGVWGSWDVDKAVWNPLAIAQGGTGAITGAKALENLGVPGVGQEFGATMPSAAKNPNGITINGIYAGAGDGATDHFHGYSPLLHMSRYKGAVQGQFQIMENGRCATRGSKDGVTWGAWGEILRVGDYGVGATVGGKFATKCGFIADADGATTWAPSNGAGVQSQYGDNRIAQMWVDVSGRLHSRFLSPASGNANGLTPKTTTAWNPVAYKNADNGFTATQTLAADRQWRSNGNAKHSWANSRDTPFYIAYPQVTAGSQALHFMAATASIKATISGKAQAWSLYPSFGFIIDGGGTADMSGFFFNAVDASTYARRYIFPGTGIISTPKGNITPPVSDIRLKEDIRTSPTGALDRICKIKQIDFTWTDTGRKDRGFSAQQLQQIDEKYVFAGGTREDLPDLLNVSTFAIVSDLIGAVKEQRLLISLLAAEIDKLKAK